MVLKGTAVKRNTKNSAERAEAFFRAGGQPFCTLDAENWRKRVGVEPTGDIEDAARRF